MEGRLLRTSQRLQLIYPRRQCSRSRYQHTKPSNTQASLEQANPIGDYYASLLESPTPKIASRPPTTDSGGSDSPFSAESPKILNENAAPSIIFSSRLSSPLERRSEIQKKSTLEAGIWVPPRPEEPDNCCMSGCVNCVWDRYRDELEEWAVARREAHQARRKEDSLEIRRKKRRQEESIKPSLKLGGAETGAQKKMDDVGGSETNWGTRLEAEFTSEDLFQNVPVGIREFMKQEKRLKDKRARDGTSA